MSKSSLVSNALQNITSKQAFDDSMEIIVPSQEEAGSEQGDQQSSSSLPTPPTQRTVTLEPWMLLEDYPNPSLLNTVVGDQRIARSHLKYANAALYL